MSRVLVVRHVAHEGLGAMKRPIESGAAGEYADLFKGDALPARIDGFDGLVVLGGPMGVYEEDKYPFISVTSLSDLYLWPAQQQLKQGKDPD